MIPQTTDVYAREVVIARVGHLIRRKQREIEPITRILRGLSDPSQVKASERGRIKRIILIGPYARRSWYEDRRTIEFSEYEFCVIVNHPLFTDELCWRRAQATIDRETGNRGAVDVGIHSKSGIRAAKAERDTFIFDRIEGGIAVNRVSRHAPLPIGERGGDWP